MMTPRPARQREEDRMNNPLANVKMDRDLSWMVRLCNPVSLDWHEAEPVRFEIPWPNFKGVIERVPAVCVRCGPMEILSVGELPRYTYRGPFGDHEYLKVQRDCLLEDARLLAEFQLPQPPVEIVDGVEFEPFKRWVEDCAAQPFAHVLGAVIDRRDLRFVLAHVPPEPLTLAWPQRDGEIAALHIFGLTWKIYYLTVPPEEVPPGTLDVWKKG